MRRWNRWLLCGSLCVVLGAGLACKKDDEDEAYTEETATEMAVEDTSATTTEMSTSTDMGTDMGTEAGTESPPP